MMLWLGSGHGELSEGSLDKSIRSAVYFYDAGGSAVVELIGPMYQARNEDFTQRVGSSSPTESQH